MINPDKFVEKNWKRPIRIAAELGYGKVGSLAYRFGFNRDYPKNTVFIIGSPRSGTSIFNTMISTNPRIVNLSEAIYIWEPRDLMKSRKHVLTELDATNSDIARIRGSFGLYQLLKNKPFFVNKNPRNSVRIGFINKIFPDAIYIHIVRDGRAVVNSILNIIKRQKHRKKLPLGGFCKPPGWKKLLDLPDIEKHSRQWVGIMNEIESSKKSITKDSWIEVKYEDICENPSKYFIKIFDRLGLDYDSGILSRINLMAKSQNFKWREDFSKQEISLTNEIMSYWLKKYEYLDHF